MRLWQLVCISKFYKLRIIVDTDNNLEELTSTEYFFKIVNMMNCKIYCDKLFLDPSWFSYCNRKSTSLERQKKAWYSRKVWTL